MDSKQERSSLYMAAAIFAVLTIAGVVMALLTREVASEFEQHVLVNFGSAMFGGGLAFFLVQAFEYRRRQ